jgi:hypothetical protein
MEYEIICEQCGATFWVRGHVESDTNALVFNENDRAWDESCEHIKAGDDFKVGDSEPIDGE